MKKILIVDDFERIVENIVEGLKFKALIGEIKEEVEFQPFFTKSCGHDALEWVETNKPDLAILDILLNGISGLDISKKLMEMYKDVKIIFLTGCAETSKELDEVRKLSEKYDNISLIHKTDSNNPFNDLLDEVVNGIN